LTELDEAALRALGRDPKTPMELLAGSASGSRVYRLPDAVVKITTADSWREPAQRELWCYRELPGRVPVLMPTLLGCIDTDEMTALLLSAHQPAIPAAEWDHSAWLEVVGQLAELQATAPRPDILPPDWQSGILSAPSAERIAMVSAYWDATEAATVARRFIDSPAQLADALAASPISFMHGDCHVGNLLRDDAGRLVWTDWQGASVGHGVGELTFLCGRANADGADPPREEMLRRYVEIRGIDLAETHRAALAAELGALVFAWPEYASWNSPATRDRLTERLLRLAAEWTQARPWR
jgi:hypothetical protein